MEDNCVIVGPKSVGIYLKVIRSKFSQTKELVLKTRGKLISTACFIACVLEEEGIRIKDTKIINSKYKDKEGKEKLVPEVEIKLMK